MGKKIRVMVFRCAVERRKTVLRLIGLMGVAWLLCWACAGLSGYSPAVAIPPMVVALMTVVWTISPRCTSRGEGWFHVKGIAPAAMARLEEIQGRLPTRGRAQQHQEQRDENPRT